jgi:hypothetical protein
MRRARGWTPLFLLMLLAALGAVAPSLSQAQVDTSKSIAIRPAKPPKPVKFAGVVLSANVQSITVRSNENQKVIRTFTYSPNLQPKMRQLLSRGGYQYGDNVRVVSDPGSNVALRISGKPSKPKPI